METNEVVLEVKDLCKSFKDHVALDKVSLRIRRGRIFGLLGPNGAGKTTLIRIINRIIIPDSGQVFLKGNPSSESDLLLMGYLPEERGLYKKMKVGEQAIYLAQLRGLSKSVARQRLVKWFEKFDIMPWWNKKVEELSKGMAQKLQFIITVLHDPDLLILDEPFSGFDPINVNLLKNEILKLRDEGKTIIFSTHNMESVEEICDDCALINHSRVVLDGQVDQIKRNYSQYMYVLRTKSKQILSDTEHYHVVESKFKDEMYTYFLKDITQQGANALLERLLPLVEVCSFEEYLPSMNDIFLHTVGTNSTWANQQYENKFA